MVNNAGVMHSANLADLTGAAFDEAMAVNLKSAVMMTQVSVKHLETSSLKAVVNVSSIAGLRAYPGAIAYKMSKAGMDQLTRCSAVELAPKGRLIFVHAEHTWIHGGGVDKGGCLSLEPKIVAPPPCRK